MIALFAAVVAFVTALAITRVMETFSRRRGLLDVPNARSSHVVPTPRTGGVGIIAGVACGWVVAAGWQDPAGIVILAAALALGLVGLADDTGRVGVLGKSVSQLGSATIVTLALSPQLDFQAQWAGFQVEGLAAALLTVLWLTALINAFNFMDGIDGMLGWLTVAVSIVGLGLVTPDASVVLLVTASASLGFLVWNHPPASIFMGDVGSQFLGLLVGASLLRQSGGAIDVIPTVMIVAVLLFDTGFTLARRLRAGKNVFAAHREHLYQRLSAVRGSHRSVTALYAILTAVAGSAALNWAELPSVAQLAILAMFVLGAGVLAWVVKMERVAPADGHDD